MEFHDDFFPKLLIIFKRQLIIFPTSFCSEAKYPITKIFPVPRFCHHFSPSTFSAFYTGISGILIAYCVRLISLTENSTQKTISWKFIVDVGCVWFPRHLKFIFWNSSIENKIWNLIQMREAVRHTHIAFEYVELALSRLLNATRQNEQCSVNITFSLLFL